MDDELTVHHGCATALNINLKLATFTHYKLSTCVSLEVYRKTEFNQLNSAQTNRNFSLRSEEILLFYSKDPLLSQCCLDQSYLPLCERNTMIQKGKFYSGGDAKMPYMPYKTPCNEKYTWRRTLNTNTMIILSWSEVSNRFIYEHCTGIFYVFD